MKHHRSQEVATREHSYPTPSSSYTNFLMHSTILGKECNESVNAKEKNPKCIVGPCTPYHVSVHMPGYMDKALPTKAEPGL